MLCLLHRGADDKAWGRHLRLLAQGQMSSLETLGATIQGRLGTLCWRLGTMLFRKAHGNPAIADWFIAKGLSPWVSQSLPGINTACFLVVMYGKKSAIPQHFICLHDIQGYARSSLLRRSKTFGTPVAWSEQTGLLQPTRGRSPQGGCDNFTSLDVHFSCL